MSTSEHLAVNFVILPEPKLNDWAIELNRYITRDQVSPAIVLNPTDCLPHITLAMGIIHRGNLIKAEQLLTELAAKLPFHVLYKAPIYVNDLVWLPIGLGKTLEKIHYFLLAEAPWKPIKAEAEMFADEATEVADMTLHWLDSFITHSSGEFYWPHLTLGFGRLPEEVDCLPAYSPVTRLALVHQGNFCTARKILHEVKVESIN